MDPSLAGRLAEPFVLSLLSRGPMHGYALLKALEGIFGEGAVPKARVYQILRRLREHGHIEETGDASDRKEHTLTDKGRELLAQMRDQRQEFFNELLMLFPGMESELRGRANGGKSSEESLPRDGARTQLACPGCQDLSLSMERRLPGVELLIRVHREGEASRPHLEGCVVGLALRRLAASLLP